MKQRKGRKNLRWKKQKKYIKKNWKRRNRGTREKGMFLALRTFCRNLEWENSEGSMNINTYYY